MPADAINSIIENDQHTLENILRQNAANAAMSVAQQPRAARVAAPQPAAFSRPGEAENAQANAQLDAFQQERLAAAQHGQEGMNALNAARGVLRQESGSGFIEINGQRYDSNGNPGNDAPGPSAEVANDTLDDLQRIAPLVQRGILGAADVQSVVKTSAMGDIAEQRNSRKAQRDMQAIMSQSADGTFTDAQTAGAMESLKRTYGETTLLTVPGYADLVGKKQQIEQGRLEKIRAYADQNGLPPETFMWDEQTDSPVLNPKVIAVQQHKLMLDAAKAQQTDMAWQNQRKDSEMQAEAIGGQIKAVTTLMGQSHKNGVNDPALMSVLQNLVIKQNNVFKGMQGGNTRPSAQPDAIAPPAYKKPMAQASSFASFNSTDEMITALKTGQHKVGQAALINGVPWIAGPDGVLRKAR